MKSATTLPIPSFDFYSSKIYWVSADEPVSTFFYPGEFKGEGWYFSDEVDQFIFGPYETVEAAEEAQKKYLDKIRY